jgi:Staphylococcal nuclease homologue
MRQVVRQRRGRHGNACGNLARRQPVRPFADQKPKHRQAMLLGERGDRFHGTPIFHSSSILETWNERKQAFTLLAVCYVGGESINERIVREGWALDYRKYSTDYLQAEAQAKRAGAGIWRGEFTAPWEWRAERR